MLRRVAKSGLVSTRAGTVFLRSFTHRNVSRGRRVWRSMSGSASAWRCGCLSMARPCCFAAPVTLCRWTPEVRFAGFPHARRTDGDPFRFRQRRISVHARDHSPPLWQACSSIRGFPGGNAMTSTFLWTLIAIQIAMGAFDTFYHHELTERLAWRRSQRHELQLHGVRNTLYALLFLTLGWLEVR